MAAKRPHPAQWFRAEIATGLQTLVVIRLPNAPSAETTRATAEVWVATLWNGRHWDQHHDTARLRTAFQRLARNCDRWPAPKTLAQHLPAREPVTALPAPKLTHQQRCANIAKLREIAAILANTFTPEK